MVLMYSQENDSHQNRFLFSKTPPHYFFTSKLPIHVEICIKVDTKYVQRTHQHMQSGSSLHSFDHAWTILFTNHNTQSI